MIKTKEATLLQQACAKIPGFSELYTRLDQRVTLDGKSDSLLHNYSRQLAKIALHYNRLPGDLTNEEISQYLYDIAKRHKTPSDSYFKFVVYSLRFLFKLDGLTDKYVALPVLRHDKKLPVVLSREEIKKMIEVTKLKKHRVLIMLLYGCGLRRNEARKLKLADLDFDRKMLFVRDGKGGKDRYVPMSSLLIAEISSYIMDQKPSEYLFDCADYISKRTRNAMFSSGGVKWALNYACTKAEIAKRVSAHTLRHTYATHLLEDGLDIVSIKNLLGHVRIETTMVYLHVAQCDKYRAFSPLDTLYGIRKSSFNAEPVQQIRQCPFQSCGEIQQFTLASQN